MERAGTMIHYDSYESERLKKLIAHKETYLQTLSGDKGKAAYQLTQREIMFLKNDLLPVILQNTNILHSEISKYIIKAFEKSLELDCNGLLVFIPIKQEYSERPKVGIYNSRANMELGTPGALEIYIDNMDLNQCKVHPMNINLNNLL